MIPGHGQDVRRPAAGGADAQPPISVLVVDDHLAFGELLALAVTNSTGIVCVGVATSGREGLVLAERECPDVVVTDLRMAGAHDGIDLCRRLTATSDVCVILLTAYADRAVIAQAAEAQACAVVAKTGSLEDILSTIRRARRGDFVVDAALLAPNGAAATGRPRAVLPVDLTDREAQVLSLLARGLDVTTVARRMNITMHTARGYVKALLLKLDAHSQLEAVVKAMDLGLVPPPGGVDALAHD